MPLHSKQPYPVPIHSLPSPTNHAQYIHFSVMQPVQNEDRTGVKCKFGAFVISKYASEIDALKCSVR